MFDNIGSKIKAFAKGVFIVETISGILSGVGLLIGNGWDSAFWAILIIVASPFVAWASAFLIYGFGQLIDNSDKLVANSNKLVREIEKTNNGYNEQVVNSQNITEQSVASPNATDENESMTEEEEFRKWRDEGLITEEEYLNKKLNID